MQMLPSCRRHESCCARCPLPQLRCFPQLPPLSARFCSRGGPPAASRGKGMKRKETPSALAMAHSAVAVALVSCAVVESMKRNIEHNDIGHKVTPSVGDARLVMLQARHAGAGLLLLAYRCATPQSGCLLLDRRPAAGSLPAWPGHPGHAILATVSHHTSVVSSENNALRRCNAECGPV